MSKSKDKEREKSIPIDDDVLANAISLSTQGSTLKRITNIRELLHDRETLLKIAEVVATGGSINTAEMAVGLPPGLLKGWLRNGKYDQEGTDYHAFYRFYLAAASEARRAAEASLLMKNPAAWLDRCDPLKELEEADQTSKTVEGSATKKETTETHVEYREFGTTD